MNVGENIRQRRTRLRMSQQQLAAGKWSRSYISQIESGKLLPSLSTLLDLAERLDTTAGDLIGDAYLLAMAKASVFRPDVCRGYLEQLPRTTTTIFLEGLANTLQSGESLTCQIPPNAPSYYLAARVLIYRQKYQEATEVLEKGLRYSDQFWRILFHYQLCMAWQRLGCAEQYQKALAKLEQQMHTFFDFQELSDQVLAALSMENDTVRSAELADLLAKVDWSRDFAGALSLVSSKPQPHH